VRKVQGGIVPRPDPLRLHSAEDQAGDHGFVRVAADQQVTPAAGHASMSALTESELPQVEKKACSAPTASAISSSAWDR
jgi:hypothetical protein